MSTPPNRLVISSISTGLQTYDKPFLLNNDAFPVLENTLCWRKRIIKKPGSKQLGQLQRSIGTASMGATTITITIIPASMSVPIPSGSSQFIVGSSVYTDANVTTAAMVNLVTASVGASGTLNRQTGVVVLNFPALAANTSVIYVPGLPVMGIEEFESSQLPNASIDFPENVFFDTVYSYLFSNGFVDNSFFVSSDNLCYWSGATYQQFDSANYYRAMFVTNNNPGYRFAVVHSVADQTSSTITMVIYTNTAASGGVALTTLSLNDLLFFNQGAGATWTLNLMTGKITDVSMAASGQYVVTFPTSQTVSAYTTDTSIAQLLTSVANGSGDGIRWYDGTGFSNFSPPLDNLSSNTSTYLVGARIVIPFGNRLLAIGTFESTSAQALSGINIYYGNRIRYCQVTATPFYANSPANVTSTALAWASNIQGFGGFIDLDTNERIISAAICQGVVVLGLESAQRKMNITGIEVDPFFIEETNPEYGTAGTHSIIPMDKGILTAGEYGFIISSSYDSKRFDQPIIDQIFQISPDDQGFERISGGRDFVNEVVYFSYPSVYNPEDVSSNPNFYPDTTVVFNYREGNFAVWLESVTTYGTYKSSTGQESWSTLTEFVWEDWGIPWANLPNSSSTYPYVAFGTPQGFIMLKWDNPTTNDPSMDIQNVSSQNADKTYSITSVNHNLSPGMYIGFFPMGGSIPSFIGEVSYLGDTSGNNESTIFSVNFDSTGMPANIIPGVWQMSIVDLPFLQTRQFPTAWSDAKKTRIGAQKYFLDTTSSGEFTVDILGSQAPESLNNSTMANPLPSLISSAIVRTRPDDSLGINGAQAQQTQIWHRLASSCIGDTVQLQMSFSDPQMRNVSIAISPWVLHSAILDLYPSRTLA